MLRSSAWRVQHCLALGVLSCLIPREPCVALALSCISPADELPESSGRTAAPLRGQQESPASPSVFPGPSSRANTHACFSSGSCGEAPACFPDTSAQVAFSPPHAILLSVVVPVFPLGMLVSLPMLLWYCQGPILRSSWWEGEVGRGCDKRHRLRLHSLILTTKPPAPEPGATSIGLQELHPRPYQWVQTFQMGRGSQAGASSLKIGSGGLVMLEGCEGLAAGMGSPGKVA